LKYFVKGYNFVIGSSLIQVHMMKLWTHKVAKPIMGLLLQNPRKNNNFNVVIVKMFKIYYNGKNGGLCTSLGNLTIGFKWSLMSQCVYLGLRLLSFWCLFAKNHFFHRKVLSVEFFCNLLFVIFTIAPICHIFVFIIFE
jgi:hypothetical protein